mgnify:CR=1 FL=1
MLGTQDMVMAMSRFLRFAPSAATTASDSRIGGTVITTSTLFCLIMLIVDLLYAYIDPRLKAKYKS